jgi:hypothetical protein
MSLPGDRPTIPGKGSIFPSVADAGVGNGCYHTQDCPLMSLGCWRFMPPFHLFCIDEVERIAIWIASIEEFVYVGSVE